MIIVDKKSGCNKENVQSANSLPFPFHGNPVLYRMFVIPDTIADEMVLSAMLFVFPGDTAHMVTRNT